MIDTRELRIGNYVYGWENRIYKVYELSKTINECKAFSFNPIPLTPDVAYKLQVNNAGITHGLFEMNFYEEFSFAFCKVEPNTILLYHGEECTGVKVKYVHQIQNLYFAISGEEIIVNF